jgi:hypothetical protein
MWRGRENLGVYRLEGLKVRGESPGREWNGTNFKTRSPNNEGTQNLFSPPAKRWARVDWN